MMDTETDSELIGKALSGDHSSVGCLMERHRHPTHALAHRALQNADDAQDVAQEALIYAVQHLAELRRRERFAPWLRHITLSLCADYRRRRGTRPLGEALTALTERSENKNEADRIVIHEAVAHLSEAHRTTLLLYYIGGWSRSEVADILNIPTDTVRSRLMAAKRRLRLDLDAFSPKGNTMRAQYSALPQSQMSLIATAFPKARVLSAQKDPEPWMPFVARVRLALPDGLERTVDIRSDINAARADLLPVLHRLGVAGPRLLSAPVAVGKHFLSLCEVPAGENLLLWALGGTPHRIHLATERAFEAAERLEALTPALLADPLGARLPRRTLTDEAEALAFDSQWRSDPWFTAALSQVQAVVPDLSPTLVYTDYLHFLPNFIRIRTGGDPARIAPGGESPDAFLGWPGDARLRDNPLAEYVSPWGHFGDPLLGLAMVWVYDCYPFVHTGYVEQFLWRRNLTRRDFAPRLALRALQTLQRELPVDRPPEGATYWDALHGYVETALAWM